MRDLIDELYYMVEDRLGQQELEDETQRALSAKRGALQDEIILRLGKDGRKLLETLIEVDMELETIHDQALFRTAMGLGARIAKL